MRLVPTFFLHAACLPCARQLLGMSRSEVLDVAATDQVNDHCLFCDTRRMCYVFEPPLAVPSDRATLLIKAQRTK